MLAGYSYPQHHTTACEDQQSQTARAFSPRGVNSIMHSVPPVIVPLPAFPDYSHKQVTSHLCVLHAKCCEVESGAWSNWEQPSYHCRNEKLPLTPVSHLAGKPTARTHHRFIFPSVVSLFCSPCRSLFACPDGLQSKSNSLCSL